MGFCNVCRRRAVDIDEEETSEEGKTPLSLFGNADEVFATLQRWRRKGGIEARKKGMKAKQWNEGSTLSPCRPLCNAAAAYFPNVFSLVSLFAPRV